jgi:hypothetical protein
LPEESAFSEGWKPPNFQFTLSLEGSGERRFQCRGKHAIAKRASALGSLGGGSFSSHVNGPLSLGLQPLQKAVFPITLIVILPTNKRLLDPSLDKHSKLAEQLLQRWPKLHAVRSALSLASFLAFLFSTLLR